MAYERWEFSEEFVSDERRGYLHREVEFTQIVESIKDEMMITNFRIDKGYSSALQGCKRPVFQFEVQTKTFDIFYNSPWGYRGQYCLSIDNGSKQNRYLIDLIMGKLLQNVQSNVQNPSLSVEAIEISLKCQSAKIWIYEKNQINTSDYTLREELFNSAWITNAREARAALDACQIPNPMEKMNAIIGVRAPQGQVLDVKGAWLTRNEEERLDDYKKHRSEHIRDYGFS
jgi:hypothetical protein